MTAKLVIN